MSDNQNLSEHVSGRVVYLLILVVLVQTIYPITAGPNLLPLLLYQVLYASLIVVGILLARDTPRLMRMLIALGLVWLASGTVYALNQEQTWAQLLAYGSILPFQVMVTRVLLRFIFRAHAVNRDVLYAAVAVYVLLGAIFVPTYGLVETLQPGSFADATVPPGEILPWQHFIYYSYATLTTLGYGDVLPVTLWARSLATIEAVIGVLYVTIIMARLVSLYSQQEEPV